MGNEYCSLEEMMERLHKKRPWWEEMYYCGYRFLYVLSMIPREMMWFIQRGRRGYADRDLWQFHWYLAGIVSSGVKQLKEGKTGYPADLTEEEWDEILDKISIGFRRILDVEKDPSLWDSKEISKEIEEGKELFVKHFESLWD